MQNRDQATNEYNLNFTISQFLHILCESMLLSSFTCVFYQNHYIRVQIGRFIAITVYTKSLFE
jgi:hypothetical protein